MRRIGRVDEQRYRRLHLLEPQQGQHSPGIWWSLDQHDVWLKFFQGVAQAASASGTMMAHPENADAHATTPPGRLDKDLSSRRAPSPLFAGTPARPRGPARDL